MSTSTSMKNIVVLRKELASVFQGVKNGAIGPKPAAQMNNSAGKMLSTVKVQLEYAAARKEKPSIDFMQGK